jgi:hypothetical protein
VNGRHLQKVKGHTVSQNKGKTSSQSKMCHHYPQWWQGTSSQAVFQAPLCQSNSSTTYSYQDSNSKFSRGKFVFPNYVIFIWVCYYCYYPIYLFIYLNARRGNPIMQMMMLTLMWAISMMIQTWNRLWRTFHVQWSYREHRS